MCDSVMMDISFSHRICIEIGGTVELTIDMF